MKLSRLPNWVRSPIPRHEVAVEEAEPLLDLRTFVVVGYWPGQKITRHAGVAVALELVRTWIASGATHVEVSPEWDFRPERAA